MKLFSSILLFLLFLQNQPTITSSLQEGKIHTTISYIDLTIKYDDGGDQYENNVTVLDISTKVEVWNTGSEPQSIGYNWYNPSCGYYLDVGVNITDKVGIYEGDTLYKTQCGMTRKYFDPGITTENALIRLVFNMSELVDLPTGEYIITAPTNNGIAYRTRLYSNHGMLGYKSQDLPANWGQTENGNTTNYTCLESGDQSNCVGTEVGNVKETDVKTVSLPLSQFVLFFSFLTILNFRNYVNKRDLQ